MANFAKAFQTDSIWIPRLPPWGVQRRSERKLRKRAKMESTKKTNCYYKNNYRIQSFIISCIQANRKKKNLAGDVKPFRMIFSTFFLRPASARARAPKLSSQDLGFILLLRAWLTAPRFNQPPSGQKAFCIRARTYECTVGWAFECAGARMHGCTGARINEDAAITPSAKGKVWKTLVKSWVFWRFLCALGRVPGANSSAARGRNRAREFWKNLSKTLVFWLLVNLNQDNLILRGTYYHQNHNIYYHQLPIQ